jgi:CheY-like chemotaxis protein
VSIRTLVVDDVADLRQLVRTALRLRGGFDVVGEAADGEEAIRLAAAEAPEVIVLDLALPRLAGTELIGRLRQVAPAAKIVVFTGTTAGPDDLGVEVEGFVRKSDDVLVLVERLEQVAARAAAAAMLELPADPSAAGTARHFVRELCRAWDCADAEDQAMVVVSELVTNAWLHAGTSCTLQVLHQFGALRLEVADPGDGSPDPHVAGDEDEHGRGLVLVSVMSQAWGVEPADGGGKVVWAEMECHPEM